MMREEEIRQVELDKMIKEDQARLDAEKARQAEAVARLEEEEKVMIEEFEERRKSLAKRFEEVGEHDRQ